MRAGEDRDAEVVAEAADTVWRLATALARSTNFAEVAEALAGEGALVAEGTFADIALCDRLTHEIHVHRHGIGGMIAGATFDAGGPHPSCAAVDIGLPVLCGSLEEVQRRFPWLVEEMAAEALQARASIPLAASDGVILGAVAFAWREPQEFGGAQLRRLDLIAQLGGLALDRVHDGQSVSEGRGPFGLETMPSAFFSLDAELRITYLNAEAERAFGSKREDLIGRNLAVVLPETAASNIELPFQRAMKVGRPATYEEFYPSLGGWFEVHIWPDRFGLNVSLWNIDERRVSEAERAVALNEAEQSKVHLSLLSDLSSRLRGVATRLEIFENLSRTVVPALGDWSTVVVPEGDELVRVAAAHRDPVLDGLAKRLIGSYPHKFSGPSPGVVVYQSGQPLRLDQLAQEIVDDLDDSASSAAYGRTLLLLGNGPGLIVPIHSRGEVVAVLTMARSEDRIYDDAEVATILEVVLRVALALDAAMHLEIERATAGALQAAALPKSLPQSDRIELAAGYLAASEGSQVGGDWYDAIELSGGRLALVVGDAAGHGLQAAALMAQMRNALRAYLVADLGPGESLGSLRRLVATQEPEAFATIICLEIDLTHRVVLWASAGHLAPILLSGEGTSSYLRGETAPPIGWIDGEATTAEPVQKVTLAPGDRLLLFTDGLVERRGVDLDIGITHLMILAEQTRAATDLHLVCDTIVANMLAARHEDDVCLLLAELR